MSTHTAPPSSLPRKSLSDIWNIAYIVAITAFVVLLFRYHAQILLASIPLDYYEGTMPWITSIFAEGDNPYTRAYQPRAMDVYPPLYNIIVAPFTLVFGNTLELHRAISAVFIFASCGLCILACYRHSGSKIHSAAAGAMVYAALLFYSTPVASTNALGVFLYLSILLVPWLFNFSVRSLAVAVVCGLLAFYAKQYFIAAMGILCLYLFFYRSKLAGIILGSVYAVLLIASVAVVHSYSPYFLDNTLFAAGISIYRLLSTNTLLKQIVVYLQTYWPLLVIAGVLVIAWLRTNGWAGLTGFVRQNFGIGSLKLKEPLLKQPPDYFVFCFFWASVVTLTTMGRNPGNFMTYLFQMMSPFLLIASFSMISRLPGKLKTLQPLVIVAFFQSYSILPPDFSTTRENWDKVEKIIVESDDIYASQMLLMLLIKHDKAVHQDGHTYYFPVAIDKPDFLKHTQPEDTIEAIWNEYLTDTYRKIQNREFDVILVNTWDFRGLFVANQPPFSKLEGKKFLRKHYYLDEKFPLSMTERYGGGTYMMSVWRPKPRRSAK